MLILLRWMLKKICICVFTTIFYGIIIYLKGIIIYLWRRGSPSEWNATLWVRFSHGVIIFYWHFIALVKQNVSLRSTIQYTMWETECLNTTFLRDTAWKKKIKESSNIKQLLTPLSQSDETAEGNSVCK